VVRVVFCGFLTAVWLIGASPVAKVRSSEPFTLSGVAMSISGVESWPVVLGDEIVTASGAARIEFGDGRSFHVMPNSKVRLAAISGRTEAVVEGGSGSAQAPKIVKRNSTKPPRPPSVSPKKPQPGDGNPLPLGRGE
jgi:hypothetical protein